MSNKILTQNHYSLTITNDVQQICEPFFKQYHIKHFTYLRFFDDGSLYTLISNKDLYQHHINQEYLVTPIIDNQNFKKKFHYFVMPNLNDGFDQAAYDYQILFGISYPIYFFERSETYFDLFAYASTENSPVAINRFINNINIFENFKFFFKEKASTLIKMSNLHRIHVPQHMRSNVSGTNSDKIVQEKLTDTLVPKRYFLKGALADISLTKREIETVKYVARSYTSKEAAKLENISFRTMQGYWDDIKLKLGVKKKYEVLEIIKEAGII